jgi:hypothetical protein
MPSPGQIKAAQAAAAAAAAAQRQALTDSLAELQRVRGTGLARKLEKIGPMEEERWYRTDAELMAEIASLNRRLGNQPPAKMVVRSSKGW